MRTLVKFGVTIFLLFITGNSSASKKLVETADWKKCSERCVEANKASERAGIYKCSEKDDGMMVSHPCTMECLAMDTSVEDDFNNCFCQLCQLTNGTEFCGADNVSLYRSDCDTLVCTGEPQAWFGGFKCRPSSTYDYERRKRNAGNIDDDDDQEVDFRKLVDEYFRRKSNKGSPLKGTPLNKAPPAPTFKEPICKDEEVTRERTKSQKFHESYFFLAKYFTDGTTGVVTKRLCRDVNPSTQTREQKNEPKPERQNSKQNKRKSRVKVAPKKDAMEDDTPDNI